MTDTFDTSWERIDRSIRGLSPVERIRLWWRLTLDPRVATWAKWLVPLLAMIYVISPVDAIPDILLGLGQVDDVGIIAIALFLATRVLPRLSPRSVVAEHLGAMMNTDTCENGTRHRDDIIEAEFIDSTKDRSHARERGTAR